MTALAKYRGAIVKILDKLDLLYIIDLANMPTSSRPKVYFIPGMGADERMYVFQKHLDNYF